VPLTLIGVSSIQSWKKQQGRTNNNDSAFMMSIVEGVRFKKKILRSWIFLLDFVCMVRIVRIPTKRRSRVRPARRKSVDCEIFLRRTATCNTLISLYFKPWNATWSKHRDICIFPSSPCSNFNNTRERENQWRL
jgi:hypothetical protein